MSRRRTDQVPTLAAAPVRAAGEAGTEEFDRFFRAVFPKAVAVAQRVTGERSSAEDAAVEALAKAHLRWRKIGAEARHPWVMKVAVNEAIRRLPKSRELPRDQFLVASDPADAIALRHTLATALGALPRRQCEVIVLRYLVGLSETEVASTLNISHGTVKTHLRRGISRLRDTVGRELKEDHLARLT